MNDRNDCFVVIMFCVLGVKGDHISIIFPLQSICAPGKSYCLVIAERHEDIVEYFTSWVDTRSWCDWISRPSGWVCGLVCIWTQALYSSIPL